MGQDIPKQFLNVHDKPVLIYTLEGFQKHPGIDAIEVVCLDGWHDVLWAYSRQFGIDKLKWVVSGGNTGQESIRNGVFNLEGKCAELSGTEVVFDLPSETEAADFSKATKARLDGSRLRALGWRVQYSLQEAIGQTLQIMEETHA